MGWKDFFKKPSETEEEIISATFNEAGDLIKEYSIKKEKIFIEIRKKINEEIANFILDLKNQIKTLDSIDLKDKKENEKIKLINLQNLKEYIEQLNRLSDRLSKIKNILNMGSYFNEINSSIDSFIKNSRRKLHMATILIGDEIAQTEQMIKSFHNKINKSYKENEDSMSNIKLMVELKNFKESLKEVVRIQKEIKDSIADLDKLREKTNIEKNEKEKEIKIFKEGKEFKDWIKKKEQIKKEILLLNTKLSKLKEKIEIKPLLKKFHGANKAENLLNNYRNNFFNALVEDKELEILDFLESEKKIFLGDEIANLRREYLRLRSEEKSLSINKSIEDMEEFLKKKKYNLLEVTKRIEGENKKLSKFDERYRALLKKIVKITEDILGNVKIIDKIS